MAIARKNKRAEKHGKVEHPTLAADAALLGVTPSHLWRCLKRKRFSRSLINKYRALKAIEAEMTTTTKKQ